MKNELYRNTHCAILGQVNLYKYQNYDGLLHFYQLLEPDISILKMSMKICDKIDLHMHTIISDGTDSPEEILEKARKLGLDVFAVTDHDAIKGAVQIQKLLKGYDGIFFLNGVEFSCRDELGKYHILGYHYDAQALPIQQLVDKAHELRMKKVAGRLDFLSEEFGITFPAEDVQALLRLPNPGKPHIAKLMIHYGYADSIKDAMQRYLNKKKFPDIYICPEEAIAAILNSGGVPVLAHPAYGDGDQLILGEEMNDRIRHLLKFGIAGMECYYSGFPEKIILEMLEFADRYSLYVTAGSDYHGGNKIVRMGDTNLSTTPDGMQRVRNFLEQF